MSTFLLVTTSSDLSAEAILDAARQFFGSVKVINYSDSFSDLEELPPNIDIIYFRDPYNDGDRSDVTYGNLINDIVKRYPNANYVDGTKTKADMLIEDKWLQYKLLNKFMPHTLLLDNPDQFVEGAQIAKERLSSRGRGIAFSQNDLNPSRKYIVQSLLDIEKEYRVFMVGSEVVPNVAVRSSKTQSNKVKMLNAEPITKDLQLLSNDIYTYISGFDLVGLDIARTKTGRLLLIEINRSPQFVRYNELTGGNLADRLMGGLV